MTELRTAGEDKGADGRVEGEFLLRIDADHKFLQWWTNLEKGCCKARIAATYMKCMEIPRNASFWIGKFSVEKVLGIALLAHISRDAEFM